MDDGNNNQPDKDFLLPLKTNRTSTIVEHSSENLRPLWTTATTTNHNNSFAATENDSHFLHDGKPTTIECMSKKLVLIVVVALLVVVILFDGHAGVIIFVLVPSSLFRITLKSVQRQ
jgi:hypothetical protein